MTAGSGIWQEALECTGTIDQWIENLRRVLVEEVSKRQILRATGMHWQTLEKVLRHCGLWQDRAPGALPPPWPISERLPVPAHLERDGDFLQHHLWEQLDICFGG